MLYYLFDTYLFQWLQQWKMFRKDPDPYFRNMDPRIRIQKNTYWSTTRIKANTESSNVSLIYAAWAPHTPLPPSPWIFGQIGVEGSEEGISINISWRLGAGHCAT